MKKIELFIVPNTKENQVRTRLVVDGNQIDSKDNRLTNLVVFQPMRKWLNPYRKKLFMWEGLLPEIISEFNDKSVHFIFHGSKTDFTLFKRSLLRQQAKLNRNGGAVEAVFEHIDHWNLDHTIRELNKILEELWQEADSWGGNDIMKDIDAVRAVLNSCTVAVKPDYAFSAESLAQQLQQLQMTVQPEAALNVIPVDGTVSLTGFREFLEELTRNPATQGLYLVVSTSKKENEPLFDIIVSLDSTAGSVIKYLENDGDDYLQEIGKIYYQAILPAATQRTEEILELFPDHKTNSYLIDLASRLEDLFCILMK